MKNIGNNVDIAEMNAAIDMVLAVPPRPRAERKRQRTQREDRQSSLVKGTKGSYKSAKP